MVLNGFVPPMGVLVEEEGEGAPREPSLGRCSETFSYFAWAERHAPLV